MNIKKSIHDLIPDFKTGDLLLFHGAESMSEFNEFLERTEWSHVAMVVIIKGIEYPLLWESTTLDNIEDIHFHDKKDGPKVVPLLDRIKTYKGYQAYRKLDIKRTEEMVMPLYSYLFEVHGVGIPTLWKSIVEVVEGKLLHKTVTDKKIFCSELIATSFMKMGLLPETIVPNSFMPKDFSSKGHLNLLKGKLEPEVYIEK